MHILVVEDEALRYFTMLYGIVDLETNRVKLTQAGHPPPFHQRGATLTTIGSGGFPVGMLPGIEYDCEEFDFQPGDRLILYSDGISECFNADDVQFSAERLAALLRDRPGLALQDTVKDIEHSRHQWRGVDSFDDDVTLLALERV